MLAPVGVRIHFHRCLRRPARIVRVVRRVRVCRAASRVDVDRASVRVERKGPQLPKQGRQPHEQGNRQKRYGRETTQGRNPHKKPQRPDSREWIANPQERVGQKLFHTSTQIYLQPLAAIRRIG